MDEPGRRILVGLEWSTVIPVLEAWDDINHAFLPVFTVGYADVLAEGMSAHIGLGYWYLTAEENPAQGGNAFPFFAELEYAPFRGPRAEAAISVRGGTVRTDIVKEGPDEWALREDGLAWYGYAAAGPVFSVQIGSFLRLHTGGRWIAFIQPNGITSFVGIPVGLRVRL
jgi:hypothetical protein